MVGVAVLFTCLRLGVWNEQEVFGTVRLAGKRGLMIDVMRLYVEKHLEPLLVRAGLREEHGREAQSLGNQAGYQIHLRIGRIVEESEISELCSVIWFIATRRLNLMIWHEERGFRIVFLGRCFIHRALRLVDLLLAIYDLNVYHTRKINGRENSGLTGPGSPLDRTKVHEVVSRRLEALEEPVPSLLISNVPLCRDIYFQRNSINKKHIRGYVF